MAESAYTRGLAEIACAACGVPFRPRRSSSRFCSRPCARTINGGQNRKAETWWVNSRGYVEGRIWIDGVQVRVKKHRHVVEQALGRKLLPTEDVHHRDGDKLNNDLSNLEVLAHGEHTTITNNGRAYKRGYRLNLSAEQREAWVAKSKAARAVGVERAALRRALGQEG